MKNTKQYTLINTIAMELEDFKKLVEKLTNCLKTVEYEFGAYITDTQKAIDMDTYWKEDIHITLSNYFDTTVTSWHSDTADYPTVYICYK